MTKNEIADLIQKAREEQRKEDAEAIAVAARGLASKGWPDAAAVLNAVAECLQSVEIRRREAA